MNRDVSQSLSATPPTLRPTGSFGRGLLIVTLLSDALLMALVFTVLPPVLPAIAQQFDAGEQGRLVAQMVMTMPSLGLIVGGLFGGWVVDRYNPRQVLAVGLIAFAVSGSAGLYLDTPTGLIVSRFVLGMASTSVTTAAAWYLGTLFNADARVRLLGYRNAVGSFGGTVSTFLAGPLAAVAGWRAPFGFYLVALLVLVMAMAVIPRLEQARSEIRTAPSLRSFAPLWPIYAITIPICIVLIATMTQLSFLLADEGFNSPTTQSWVIGTASLTSIIGAALYGLSRRHMGVRGTFALMVGLLGGGNILIGLSHTPLAAAVGCGVAGFGSGIATPYLCNLVLDRTGVEIRGRALGLLYSAMFFGDFLNPFVFTPISTWFGLHGAFLVVGSGVFLCAPMILLIRPRWMELPAGGVIANE